MSHPQLELPFDDDAHGGGQTPAGDGRRHRAGTVAGVGVAVAAALAGAAIAHFAWSGSSPAQPTSSAQSGTSGSGANAGTTTSTSVSALASRVDGALVDINTTLGGTGEAAGTGMVVTSTGEVLTNNHVIDGATKITATDVGNGRTYAARVVGYDRSKDIAVIQLVDASNLQTVTFGNSSSVRVGQSVVTIGNAGGAGGTPSAAGGSVTALGQSITASDEVSGSSEQLTDLIELNGSLEPGDSGGPLVDSAGNVIGMDTAASSGFSFQSSGTQGFAVPIDDALSIATKIEHGTSSGGIHIGATSLIGVEVGASNQFGFGNGAQAQGAYVDGVVSGTPAASAGIEPGDTITSFGGRAVTSATSLTNAKERFHPGSRVSITWVDSSGNSHSATVRLTAGPAD
jgi:S1-C subfamily serine protease